jgi:aspartyl-tRNA(Asn)/glutamyl-tRNA(Gln) amidotransferase subunit C
MTINVSDLQSIAQLAYLQTNPDDLDTLAHEINSIIDFVQQLSQVNTQGVMPLLHPMDLHQRLRNDEPTEENCLLQLAEIAPHFDQDLYLVPNVMDSER